MEKPSFVSELAGLCATAMTLCYGLFIANVIYPFIPADNVIFTIITNMMYYGPLSLCAICSVNLVWKRSIILKTIFLVVWAAIIIFSFFPDTFSQIVEKWVN
jgi:hypothetical protein